MAAMRDGLRDMREPQEDYTATSDWSKGDTFTKQSRWHYFNAGQTTSLCGRVVHRSLGRRRAREWGQYGNCQTCEKALAAGVAQID